MKIIEQFESFTVYEHKSGRGVIIANVKGRGNNGAIFATPSEAMNKALAVAWGGSLTLTHRFKTPAQIASEAANA